VRCGVLEEGILLLPKPFADAELLRFVRRAIHGASTSCPDGALCTRSFLYIGRNPARTSGFS
jgi:hypothetical protein